MRPWLLAIILQAGPERPQAAAIETRTDGTGYCFVLLDFEPETDDRDLNGRPDGDRWERLSGPAYPFYSRAVLDDSSPFRGQAALRLEPDGAAVGVRTLLLPADRFHDCEVTGRVRPRHLERGVARIAIEWLAGDGARVLGHNPSEPIRGTTDWQPVRFQAQAPQDLELRWMRVVLSVGKAPTAATAFAGPPPLAPDAAAWFDAIEVRQRPRAVLATQQPTNLFLTGETKSVTLLASGLADDVTPVRLTLTDVEGREVLTRQSSVRCEPTATTLERFPLDLEEPGLYRATVSLGDARAPLAERHLWLAIAPHRRAREECASSDAHGARPAEAGALKVSASADADSSLGVTLSDRPLPRRLAEMLDRLGCRWASVPISPPSSSGQSKARGRESADDFLREAHDRQIDLLGVLRAHDDAPANPGPQAGGAPDAWGKRAAAAVAEYGSYVYAWQVGDDPRESLAARPAGLSSSALDALLGPVAATARALAPGCPLAVPWSALAPLPAGGKVGNSLVNVHIGPEVAPENIPTQLGTAEVPFWATVQLLDRSRFDREAVLSDLARRVVCARTAGARRVLLAPFVDDRLGLLLEDGSPTEALLVWRTLAEMLDGLDCIGRLRLPGGSENALFGPRFAGSSSSAVRRGVMVLWSTDGPRTERLFLEAGAERVDLFGRREALPGHPGNVAHPPSGAPFPPARAGALQTVSVNALPVFVTGVDLGLAATCASLFLDASGGITGMTSTGAPGLSDGCAWFESEYRWHDRTIEFTNRFDRRIRGYLTLLAPEGWRIEPRTLPFDLGPGTPLRERVRILFPLSAPCGRNSLRAHWFVETDSRLQAESEIPILIGLAGIEMTASAEWTADDDVPAKPPQGALVVRARVRNAGSDRSRWSAFVTVPGRPAAESGVFLVPGGAEAERRFVLRTQRGAPAPGSAVTVSLRELGGQRFLNQEMPIPPRASEWTALEPASLLPSPGRPGQPRVPPPD